jgi:hypothetical protein
VPPASDPSFVFDANTIVLRRARARKLAVNPEKDGGARPLEPRWKGPAVELQGVLIGGVGSSEDRKVASGPQTGIRLRTDSWALSSTMTFQ